MGNNLGCGYLPGQTVRLDVGDMCDTEGHEDRPAVRRIVGETDSWGSESHCMCQECATEHDNAPEPDTSGTCEWCQCHVDVLLPTRDIDEGMNGPVYDVCLACRRKQNKQAQEDLDAMEDERDDRLDMRDKIDFPDSIMAEEDIPPDLGKTEQQPDEPVL